MPRTGMKTPPLPATLWLLLLLIPAAMGAVTFRLEAEDLPRSHKVHDRSSASGGKTVHVINTSERLTFSFCFHRSFSANITTTYSNDGGSDNVRLKVHSVHHDMPFKSEARSAGGAYWNEFRSATFTGVSLPRGYHHLSLIFETLDSYGIEIDYVDVSVHDDFINDAVFRCQLVIGAEPRFSSDGESDVSEGYVKQHSYVTPCPEEDNVHLAMFHDTVKQYKLTATDPLYRSMNNFRSKDTSTCPNLDYVYWKFKDVKVSNTEDPMQYPAKNAMLTAIPLENDVSFDVKYSVRFTLKGYKAGFLDADIDSDFNIKLTAGAASSSTVRVTYQGKGDRENVLAEFQVTPGSTVENKMLNIPEMTWSEDHPNYLNIYVSGPQTVLDEVSLFRGYMYPDTEVEIYSSDAFLLRGMRSSFWWRRPVGESLRVAVGDATFANLSAITAYVPSPWISQSSYSQTFVLYQDGYVRLRPLPPNSDESNFWIPFGTSVIIGKSNPSHVRPAASIQTVVFNPDTWEMTLTYYDGSTSKLVLSYSTTETSLTVKDINFAHGTEGLPFATFRSMFVDFGNTDSDAVQTDVSGPEHVLGSWDRMPGREFLIYRTVESHHLTQSPDIRLKIQK